uniref:Cation/calcium exchanger 5 n=1 Tax=Rhizophora mucronata TaxID=61149 RepID=A0A2P2JK80_RHIMU
MASSTTFPFTFASSRDDLSFQFLAFLCLFFCSFMFLSKRRNPISLLLPLSSPIT